MKTSIVITGVIVLWILALLVACSGCNTMQGVGRDITALGSYNNSADSYNGGYNKDLR
jgi:predicted small secreted protein